MENQIQIFKFWQQKINLCFAVKLFFFNFINIRGLKIIL